MVGYSLITNILLQGRQRINDVDNEDVGRKDDDIHQQTDAHKVAEAVAARAVDQHVGGRTDRCGETTADTHHEGDEEG